MTGQYPVVIVCRYVCRYVCRCVCRCVYLSGSKSVPCNEAVVKDPLCLHFQLGRYKISGDVCVCLRTMVSSTDSSVTV